MNKKTGLLAGLCILLLCLLSCSSSPEAEFTPLDYTAADVVQNEISVITELAETKSVEALWRAALLRYNSTARYNSGGSPQGTDQTEAVTQVFDLCVGKVLDEFAAAVAEGRMLEARRLLSSLEAVDYSLSAELIEQKTLLEEKIAAATPGFGHRKEDSATVSDYISGTVTVWVDLGVQVERGVGYANRAIGSGFFIDRRGYIVTNYHVIQSDVDPEYEGYSRIYIKLSSDPETRIPAKVVGWDPLLDLALLKTEVDAPYVFSLGSSQDLDVGDRVFAIGSPAGLEWTLTSGIVSAEGRRLLSMGPVMQIDAAVNSGNSGGPIIDENGNVQAVVFAGMLEYDGLNFAIPVEYLKQELAFLAAGGKREHSWIGAYGKDHPADQFGETPAGLQVNYLMPGGSGHRSGLRVGDIITAVNGIPVDGIDSFHNVMKTLLPQTIVRLSVFSPPVAGDEAAEPGRAVGGGERILPVYLEVRPDQPGYEIYRRDLVGNAFLPIFGMHLTPASATNKKNFTVSKIAPGEIADESGFSVHDPVTIEKIEVSKEKDVIYAQLFTKKRKNGYFEVNIAIGSPLDSPYFF